MRKSVKAHNLLQLIDKKKFNKLCQKWEMDKGVRKFSTWNHVSTLIISNILRLDSLREVELVLGVPKSTLSDANSNRCSGFYDELCELALSSLKALIKSRKVRSAIDNLLAVDASTCGVHGSLASDWRWKSRSSQGNKASVGFHSVFNVSSAVIEDFRVTPGKAMETTVARQFNVIPNSTYIFDRAYRQLTHWWNIVNNGSHFVTRLVGGSPSRDKHKKEILNRSNGKVGVLFDGKYHPSRTAFNGNPNVPRDIRFRHIIYRDPESKKVFDFVTSNTRVSAQKVADIYKKRWSVELLFKWLKGHLHISYISSRNKNSVKVNLATAVLIQILTRLRMQKLGTRCTPWECLREVRTHLLRNTIDIELQERNLLRATPRQCSKGSSCGF